MTCVYKTCVMARICPTTDSFPSVSHMFLYFVESSCTISHTGDIKSIAFWLSLGLGWWMKAVPFHFCHWFYLPSDVIRPGFGARNVRKTCFNFLARRALWVPRSNKCIFFKISDEKFSHWNAIDFCSAPDRRQKLGVNTVYMDDFEWVHVPEKRLVESAL